MILLGKDYGQIGQVAGPVSIKVKILKYEELRGLESGVREVKSQRIKITWEVGCQRAHERESKSSGV